MNFRVVIPARFNSQRLPGKPLIKVVGRPIICHVIDRALESEAADVWVATDDERILKVCEESGAKTALTSDSHISGTDRIAELARREGWPEDSIVVNLQGDEPLMAPSAINQVADALITNQQASIATLASRIHNLEEYRDPNVVKVVATRQGRALYFSRAPIPAVREYLPGEELPALAMRHVGLYAYRVESLLRLSSQPVCELERMEALEQLRALWLGMTIQVELAVDPIAVGIDTAADLDRVASIFESFTRSALFKKTGVD